MIQSKATAEVAQPDATVPPEALMLQMMSGFWVSRAIYVAAKLGLADVVQWEPKSPADIALSTGTHAPSLYRLLRGLASVGIFAEDDYGRFTTTPLAATLQSNRPGSLRAFAITEMGAEHFPAWGELLYSVQTGETGFAKHYGMPVWEYYAAHPEEAESFDEAMTGLTAAIERDVITHYDFTPHARIVDVGGGHGSLMAAILGVAPNAQGVVCDLPHVIEGTVAKIAALGLTGRCSLQPLDFFEAVPDGGDLYILKWVLHDWDDDRSVTILRNCRKAMAPTSRLMIVEGVIPPGNAPFPGKFMDLNMLVMTGGRERTEAEFRTLLGEAGFTLDKITPTPSGMSLIEAT